MQFYSKSQKEKHPQVNLIPGAVWSEIFINNSIPDFIIPWMSLSYENLQKELTSVSNENKDKAWVAIIYSHPEMENQRIIDLGEQLGLSTSEMLNLAVILGDSPKHLDLLKKLSKKEPYSTNNFKNYSLRIQRAAQFGHLDILKYLIGVITSFKAFFIGVIEAFKSIHLGFPNYFIEIIKSFKTSHKQQNIIAADNFAAFQLAAERGHLDVLKYLAEKAPDKFSNMIFYAFRSTVEHGHLDVLKYLEEKITSDKLQEMIAANNFEAFRLAITSGHLNVLNYLAEKITPEQLQDIIAANDFYIFQLAVYSTNFDGLNWLAQKAPDKLGNMIASYNFFALRWAAQYEHFTIVQYLLNHPQAFSYAEAHPIEFDDRYIWPLVMQKLTTLRIQQMKAETNKFNAASPEEARLLFYIARNLIRRNNPALIEDLQFLLKIPAVKALAHTVTPNRPNELLRFALSIGNQEAATVLMNISAIQSLAEHNNHYHNEQHERRNESALAENHHSTRTTTLTQGKQQQLQETVNYSLPLFRHNRQREHISIVENEATSSITYTI